MFLTNTWIALLPPILTVVLAVLSRQIHLSLCAGIILGSIIINADLISGLTYGIVSVFHVFQSPSAIRIIIFILLIGAMIKVMERSGGIAGFVYKITEKTQLVKGKKAAQLATYFAGLLMFMEGIGSMMVAGLVGRPLFAKFGLSKERLAYIANSTGSPVAWLFPLGGAGAYLMGLLSREVENGNISGSPLTILVQAIPFQFYTLTVLLSVPLLIISNKEFTVKGKLTDDFSLQDKKSLVSVYQDKEQQGDIINMLMPLVTLSSAVFAIVFISGNGDPAAGDATAAIYWGIISTLLLTAGVFYCRRVATIKQYISWCVEGMRSMLPAAIILLLAFAFACIVEELGSALFLSNILINSLSGEFIPAAIFISCSLISFATGSSSAAVGIILPIAISLTTTSVCPLSMAIGAVVSGAVFGDQSSPISDSVIVSSIAADCKSINHFYTQIPYTLAIAVLSFALFLAAGFFI